MDIKIEDNFESITGEVIIPSDMEDSADGAEESDDEDISSDKDAEEDTEEFPDSNITFNDNSMVSIFCEKTVIRIMKNLNYFAFI